MMKLSPPRTFWFLLCAIVLIGAFAWVALRSGPLAPIRVTEAAARRADLQPILFGIGVVEARRSYLVGPSGAGRVKRVTVDVGELVRPGQLLAEMEPVDLDQRVASTAAAVSRAQSAVDSAAALLADTLSRRDLAEANARRYNELGHKGFVSPTVTEDKLREQRSAAAQFAAAQAALAGARQDLARLNAEREGAQQQRANIRLLAPAAGLVSAREAEPGSTVVAGQAVLRLIAPDSLWIKTRLDQSRSTGLQAGLPATIRLRSRPNQAIPGKVVRVELVSDSITEERIAQVAFDTAPKDLSVGEMAEVTLHLPTVKDAVLLPNAALRMHAGKNGVWVNLGNKLSFAAVTPGANGTNGSVQILEGIKEGDAVIVYSERDLAEDSRIRVVPALTAAGS